MTKIVVDLFRLFIFLNKASRCGLGLMAFKFTNKKTFLCINFLCAPISTLLFLAKLKSLDLASALERTGPVFIKFGQSLSTRSDIIGDDIASILKKLQDKLKPFPDEVAKSIIEDELKAPLEDLFSEFINNSVASASIAQVYKARLKDGSYVAVKILRPGIEEKYKKDIKILYSCAKILKLFVPKFKKIKLIEAVRTFEKTMKWELDLKSEAASCSALAQNLVKDEDVIIPKIYWHLTTTKIFVLEWIDGFSVYDTFSIENQSFTKEDILKKLSVSFFNQAFRDGFFHADLHPGNILITKNGKIAFLDFGIVGFLSEKDRLGLAEVLHSLLKRDYYRVAEIHKEIGFIPKDVNLHEFALACRAVSEPIVGKPASKLSIAHLLESLIKMTSEFSMETQPQLILLQKNIVILEGLGQILAPNVNMWNLAEPWVTKWAKKNLGFDAKLVRILKSLAYEIKNKFEPYNTSI